MANNDVNIKLNVKDGGDTAKLNKEAEKLKKAYDEAANAAGRVSKALAPAPKSMALKSADNAAGKGETKTARSVGAGAGTGSAASDFAAQASGLGGLVHVYATFAANIFAVSAAFTALSKAMDTANLVKGLDQLSAASGKNLGNLAKQMVAVADGAISMQQAMSSTAMASAGGMSNQAILRMTEVAKKASLALGRDMTDSMDRLTKGIVKTQPELLDELGIMTRMIPAQQEYARSIGKTISALTDYEKRQAFANAVLAEGEAKFGNIDLASNSYSKVLSSIQNLMQAGLELVNKVLGPIVKYLSESPVGLTIALGAAASMLLKQAVPAIGAFRENTKKMSDIAYANLVKTQKDQQHFLEQESVATSEAAIAKFKLEKGIAAELDKIRFRPRTAGTKGIIPLFEKDPFALSPEDINKMQTTATTMIDSKHKTWNEEAIRLQNHIDKINSIRARGDKFADDLVESGIARDSKWYTHESMLRRIVDKETQAYSNRHILAYTAETAAMQGPVRAWKALNKEIADSKAGKRSIDEFNDAGEKIGTRSVPATNALTNGWTRLKGGIGIATSALSTAANAFGIWGQIAGLAIAALGVIDGALSKATEQQNNFNIKLDEGTAAVKVATDALDFLGKKSKNPIGIDAITAMTNSIEGLTSSMEAQLATFDKWYKAAKWFDISKDWVSKLWGGDNATKLAEKFGDEINAAFKNMVFTPELASSTKKKLAEALRIPSGTLNTGEDVTKALSNIKDPTAYKSSAEAIVKIMNAAKEADASATTASKFFIDSMKEVDKEVDAITNKLKFKDGLGKLGSEMETLGIRLGEALKNPLKSLDAIISLVNDPKLLAVISSKSAGDMVSMLPKLTELKSALALGAKQVAEAEELVSKTSKLPRVETGRTVNSQREYGDNPKYTSAKEGLAKNQELQARTVEHLTKTLARFDDISAEFKVAGAAYIESALKDAVGKAALTRAMVDLGAAQRAGLNTVKDELSIKLKELSYKEKEIESAYNMQEAILRNTEAQTIANAEMAMARTEGKKDAASMLEYSRALKQMSTTRLAQAMRSGSSESSEDIRQLSKTGSLTDARLENKQFDNNRKAKEAALAGIGAEKYSANDKAKLDDAHAKNKLQQEWLTSQQSVVAQSLVELSVQEKYASGYSQTLSDRRLGLELTTAENTFKLDQLKVSNKIIDLEHNNRTQAVEGFDQKMKELKAEEDILQRKYATSVISLQIAALEKELANTLSLQQNIIQSRVAKAQLELSLLSSKQQIEAVILSQLKEQGSISENLYNLKTRDSAIAKINAEATLKELQNNAAIYQAEKALFNLKRVAAEQGKKDAESSYISANSGEKGNFSAEGLTAAGNAGALAGVSNLSSKTLSDAQALVDAAKAKNVEDTANIATQKSILDLQQAQLDIVLEQKAAQESMSTLFGDMGKNIQEASKAFESLVNQTKANSEAQLSAQAELNKARAEYDNASNLEDRVAASKQVTTAETKLATIKSKSAKDDISNIIAVASSTKKLYGEKTAAHKVLDGIEKAGHAYRMAIMAKEQIVKLQGIWTTFQAEVGATGMAAVAKIPSVLMSFVESMGWPGVIAGAAFVASLGLGGSSTGSVDMTGKTAKERQDLGSGQKYDENGKIVSTGGGVFGDVTAKSQSIQNSLDLIANTSVDGMNYFNDMVDLLTKIKDGITGVAQTVYGTTGLGQGSAFGTQEGTGGGAGFIGLFSSSSSTEITDAGLKFNGTFGAMVNSVVGTVQQYEDVLSKSSNSGIWGFLSTSSENLANNIKELDPKLQKQIQGVFGNADKLMKTMGEKIGMTSSQVSAILATVPVSMLASLKDLKGADLEAALTSVFSSILDDAALAVFNSFEKYRKFGEGMLETAARVIDTNEKIRASYDLIGKTFIAATDQITEATGAQKQRLIDAEQRLADLKSNKANMDNRGGYDAMDYDSVMAYIKDVGKYGSISAADIARAEQEVIDARAAAATTTTTYAYDITEALATAAGGLDKFLSATKDFANNYLTEAERLGISKKSGVSELSRLGGKDKDGKLVDSQVSTYLSTIGGAANITRDSMKSLVLGYQVTDEASAKTYVSLLNVANGLDQVFDASEAAAEKSADLKRTLKSIQPGGNTDEITQAARNKVLDAMTPEDALIQHNIDVQKDFNDERRKGAELTALEGKTYEAMLVTRELDMLGMSSEMQIIQAKINKQTDKNKTDALGISLMEAEGRSYEVLQANRAKALLGMSKEDADIQKKINTAQDKNKTDGLNLKLMGLQGKASQVLDLTRKKEKKTLSESDQVILQMIYDLEDMNALLSKAGVDAKGLASTILSGLTSEDPAAAGKYVADMVIYGIEKSMYEDAIGSVMQIVQDTIMSPVMTVLTSGAAASTVIAQLGKTSLETQVAGAISEAKRLAEYWGKIFSSQEWKDLSASISAGMADIYGAFETSYTPNVGPAPKLPDTKSAEDAKKEADDRVRKGLELDIELLHAQRKEYAALSAERALEIADLKEYDKLNGTNYAAKKELIHQAQKEAKTYDLTTTLLEAQGKAFEATNRQRDIERMALSETDLLIQEHIWQVEDNNKTQDLSNTLLELEGKSLEATTNRRNKERLALSKTDAEIQDRIWLLEDEQKALEKKNNLESRIYDLLDKANKSKELARAQERKDMDLTDTRAQAQLTYIYALEDEAELKTKTIDAIKNSISGMKSFIKTLKDMKSSMLLGGDSTLTPMQKYLESKKQIESLKDIINGPANTSAEIAARDDAMGKLPSALQEMLGFSKTVNASSEQYALDFASVGTTLDTLINSTTDSITVADRQLTRLDSIDTSLIDIGASMTKLEEYARNTETARDAAAAAGSVAATSTISNIAATDKVTAGYKDILGRPGDTQGMEFWVNKLTSKEITVDQFIKAMGSSPESINRIYQEELNRSADAGGMAFWASSIQSGSASLTDVRASIRGSTEATVRGWYSKALGRLNPDAEGLQFWMNAVDSGTMAIDTIKQYFRQGAADDKYSGDISKVPAFKSGGFHAGGLRMVGEDGPELEATGPSRIWNANQLSNALNNKELIAEIRALREEVAQLRQEQQEQTGHLIQTNYDANMKAAGKVAEATDEAANQTVWAQRNQVKLA